MLEVFDNYETKCSKTINNIKNELLSIRAGRANPHILDKVLVDYYGTPTPINQMGNVTISEARVLVINVWDASALKEVEKAIINANVGVTPNNDGKVIRLVFPELTEERRVQIVKEIRKMCEDARVAIRSHRRDANDAIRKYKKDSVITEDDAIKYEKEVDKILNTNIEAIDKLLKDKEQEVMSV
ncbi:MAG: ribosome recycling factor [Clostridia bacterium]|nr:ribosome recycling factor [Clostridia bacterium]